VATKYVLFLNPLWNQSVPCLIKIDATGGSLKTFVPDGKGTNEKFMVSESWRRKQDYSGKNSAPLHERTPGAMPLTWRI